MCLASQNNHPTSLASSWDISFLKSLVQQDPKGSNKVAHHFILDVYDVEEQENDIHEFKFLPFVCMELIHSRCLSICTRNSLEFYKIY